MAEWLLLHHLQFVRIKTNNKAQLGFTGPTKWHPETEVKREQVSKQIIHIKCIL